MTPERLNRVQIATGWGPYEIPWDSAVELRDRLRKSEVTRPIADEFAAVGATRPVELDDDGKRALFVELDAWLREVGKESLPLGLFELRHELHRDFAGT